MFAKLKSVGSCPRELLAKVSTKSGRGGVPLPADVGEFILAARDRAVQAAGLIFPCLAQLTLLFAVA